MKTRLCHIKTLPHQENDISLVMNDEQVFWMPSYNKVKKFLKLNGIRILIRKSEMFPKELIFYYMSSPQSFSPAEILLKMISCCNSLDDVELFGDARGIAELFDEGFETLPGAIWIFVQSIPSNWIIRFVDPASWNLMICAIGNDYFQSESKRSVPIRFINAYSFSSGSRENGLKTNIIEVIRSTIPKTSRLMFHACTANHACIILESGIAGRVAESSRFSLSEFGPGFYMQDSIEGATEYVFRISMFQEGLIALCIFRHLDENEIEFFKGLHLVGKDWKDAINHYLSGNSRHFRDHKNIDYVYGAMANKRSKKPIQDKQHFVLKSESLQSRYDDLLELVILIQCNTKKYEGRQESWNDAIHANENKERCAC